MIFSESEFNKIRQKNVQLCNHVTSKFKKLESKLPQKRDFRTKARMKRALYYGFFQQYIQLWTKHEAILQKYEQQLKKNLQMQSKICKYSEWDGCNSGRCLKNILYFFYSVAVNYDLTDEEIDTLIANKQTNLLMDNVSTQNENAPIIWKRRIYVTLFI